MDSPHRPEEAKPLDDLSPTLRAAVEGVRQQPVPSEAQDQALRRLEEIRPMTQTNRPLWSRPSVMLAALAASVAIAFTAGYLTHAKLTPGDRPGDTQLAANNQPGPVPEPAILPEGERAASKDGAKNEPKGDKKPDEASPTDRIPDPSVPSPVNPPEQTANPGSGPPVPPGGGLGTGGGLGGTGGPGGPGGIPGPVVQPATATTAPGYALPTPGLPGLGTVPLPNPVPAGPAAPVVSEPAKPQRPGEPLAGGEAKPEGEALAKEGKALGDVLSRLTIREAQRTKLRAATEAFKQLPANERKSETFEKLIEKETAEMPADQKKAVVDALKAQVIGQQQGQEGPGTENYNHFVDNPYQAVQKTPLSTFSVSVDTASYANMRRFLLQENRLPPPDAVRIADMVNYFHYTYPQPKGDAPVAFAMNMTNCPWNTEHNLLRVSLAAKKYSADEMPLRNFTFLIDTSGSMSSENKLPLLKKAFALLVEQLRPQDRVAIVVYAGSAGLVLPSTPGNQKETILKALDNLSAGGSTNGGQGIELAYKVAKENFIEGGLNRVILGSDGDFNVGVSSDGDLVRLIEEKRKTGVFLTILGFGTGNIKDHKMERLAHHGNGYFAYIDDLKEAKKVFVEQGGALVTVAKDVKLQIEFNPQRVAGYRLIGYENKLLRDEDFNNDAVDAGDMGSGHTVTALYEIIPAGKKVPNVEVDDLKYQTPKTPAEAANTGEFLTVKLRYKDPQAEVSKKLEQPLAGAVEVLDKSTEDMRFVAAVAEFGLLLRNSPYKGTANYGSVLEFAKSSLTKDEGGHRAEFVAMATKAKELADAIEKAKQQEKAPEAPKP